MHKSKLAGFVIDCRTGDLDAAAEFWSKALGSARKPVSAASEGRYVGLDMALGDLHVEVQMVDHPSRVHLDIESDDLEGEARRLMVLGATRVGRVEDWLVMEAPTGQRFCIVPAESADFEKTANKWS
jgi:Glyoxalase-like domain